MRYSADQSGGPRQRPKPRGAFVLVLTFSGLLPGWDRQSCPRAAETAEVNAAAEYQEPPVAPIDRKHWAYQPLSRPPLPRLDSGSDWARNPVDLFILHKLHGADLQTAPQAERRTLIRRLSFDLRGLPPTAAETQEFERDDRPDAWSRLVDRYLADDAYGERWGQHWLDLARFAETDGFEHDKVRPQAWRYRDWVIEALNADMTYDEFLTLQLAGDEVRPDDPGAHIATGFLLCGPDMPDINLVEERRHNVLNDLTSTVGSVFMAMQMGCAQCHDHKFDPISQADFYRLRACFESAGMFQEWPLPSPGLEEQRRAFEISRASRWQALEQQLQQLEQQAGLQPTLTDEERSQRIAQALGTDSEQQYQRLRQQLRELKSQQPPQAERARGLRESSSETRTAYLRIRGDFRRLGPVVTAAVPRVINSGFVIEPAVAAAPTSRQRQQLADWLTQPDNPATSRVIVNRVWQFHFGHGLCRTESDFGIMGASPSHPELLDWLATELVHRQWSLKELHRLILGSATYRQASHLPADASESLRATWNKALERDSDVRLLSRFPRRRLEGEAIRDAMLSSAGRLTRRRGGPGVRPPLPPELVSTLLKNQWPVTADPQDHNRRSIYLFVRRNLRYPIFDAFDKPDTNASCARRNISTTAPQALFLYNSAESLRAAGQLAERILSEHAVLSGSEHHSGVSDALVTEAFRRTLARVPSSTELAEAREFLAGTTSHDLQPDQPGRFELLCLTLFNLNEFLYVE